MTRRRGRILLSSVISNGNNKLLAVIACCVFVVLLQLCRLCDAAHSRRRIIVRQVGGPVKYDRSITTFDPSGRLLQVEYAMAASNRGSSFIAALIEKSSSEEADDNDNDNASTIVIVVEKSSNQKVHRIGDHVFLITSGYSGDCKFLVSHARKYCSQYKIVYGEIPTLQQVAQQIANLQHDLTRGAGIRPLACSAVIVGIDPISTTGNNNNNNNDDRLRIIRTDPGGGIMEDCRYCVGGRCNQNEVMTALGKLYDDDLVGCNDSESPSSKSSRIIVPDVVSKLVRVMMDAVGGGSDKNNNNKKKDKDQQQELVDVYTIQYSPHQRGNMQATFLKGVPAQNSNTILKEILNQQQ